jgi:hypothetical protein
MIKEIIENGNTAFICDTFKHIKQFIEISKQEGITYQKMGWKESEEEDMFEKYTQFLSTKHSSIILVKKRMISMEFGVRFEYQFRSRTYRDYDVYGDWDDYTFVNFTQILRDNKLNSILDESSMY